MLDGDGVNVGRSSGRSTLGVFCRVARVPGTPVRQETSVSAAARGRGRAREAEAEHTIP